MLNLKVNLKSASAKQNSYVAVRVESFDVADIETSHYFDDELCKSITVFSNDICAATLQSSASLGWGNVTKLLQFSLKRWKLYTSSNINCSGTFTVFCILLHSKSDSSKFKLVFCRI